MIKKIADNAPAHLDNSGKSVQKLRDCIKKLSSPDESYVQLRYLTGLSVQEISRRFNTSIRSVYYSLARIQALLLICIEREDL
jgi:DNA-directed RNA polymerase specialized sigma24 family protein